MRGKWSWDLAWKRWDSGTGKDCGKAQCVNAYGLDQASSDLSGTSDETVEIITNNPPTDANKYTMDFFC